MNIQSVNGATPSSAVALRQTTTEIATVTPGAQSAKADAVTEQGSPPTKEVPANRQQLDDAVKAVNDFVAMVNNSLQFSVDDQTGKIVVKVVDSATKEVIKQIPSEEMLAIAKALDSIKGLLVHQKA